MTHTQVERIIEFHLWNLHTLFPRDFSRWPTPANAAQLIRALDDKAGDLQARARRLLAKDCRDAAFEITSHLNGA